jgi:hypothetical protein
MDERARLDQASERKVADAAVSDRLPWHTPVIDVIPLRNAAATAANGNDGNNEGC